MHWLLSLFVLFSISTAAPAGNQGKNVAPDGPSSSEPPISTAAPEEKVKRPGKKPGRPKPITVTVDWDINTPLGIHGIELGGIYWLTAVELVSHVFYLSNCEI